MAHYLVGVLDGTAAALLVVAMGWTIKAIRARRARPRVLFGNSWNTQLQIHLSEIRGHLAAHGDTRGMEVLRQLAVHIDGVGILSNPTEEAIQILRTVDGSRLRLEIVGEEPGR